MARRASTSTRLRVGSGAGPEFSNDGAHRSMTLLGFEIIFRPVQDRCNQGLGGVCPRHPNSAGASGTRDMGAPMSVSSGHRIEVTTPWMPYQIIAAAPQQQRPPNNRMQATAGGLGVDMPTRRAFARRT